MPNLNIRHLQLFFKQITKEAETPTKTGGTTKNHSKKMKTSEFQRIQRFSFCFNCAKHADLGISIVPNSWLFFEPLKKATI